jgi:glycosyltransferase involved in cell wall biosynthesis
MITNAVDPADLQSDWTPAAARSAFGLAPNAVVVAAIGRLSREKGQDVLIEAFARAAGELPELALAIAGDGPDDTKLRERARALGLGERVKFLGHQPHVARVYAASDIVVLPSRSEGMPNALLEAMCLGRAVVSTNVGGVSEVATDGDTAWIVPSENPDALAMALLHAARDPRERARRAENARAHVRATMSPASRAARFVALYEGILGRKFSARNRDFESRSDSIGRPMDFEPTVRA